MLFFELIDFFLQDSYYDRCASTDLSALLDAEIAQLSLGPSASSGDLRSNPLAQSTTSLDHSKPDATKTNLTGKSVKESSMLFRQSMLNKSSPSLDMHHTDQDVYSGGINSTSSPSVGGGGGGSARARRQSSRSRRSRSSSRRELERSGEDSWWNNNSNFPAR